MLTHAGDEALRLAITTFVEPGGTLGTTDPSYSLYPVLSKIQDATMQTLRIGRRLVYSKHICSGYDRT